MFLTTNDLQRDEIVDSIRYVASTITTGSIILRLERINIQDENGIMLNINSAKLNNDKGVIPAIIIKSNSIYTGYVNIDYAASISLYETLMISGAASKFSHAPITNDDTYAKAAMILANYEAYVVTNPNDILVSTSVASI